MDWRTKYKKAVTFSYDDNVEQDLRLLEILNRYGLKCTFNANTGVSPEHSWVCEGKLEVHRLDLNKHIKDYEGHEIAVHTLTHPSMVGDISDEELRHEIEGDRDNIIKLTGIVPVGAAYPYGTYDDRAKKFLKEAGIKYCRTVESTSSFDEQEDLLAFKATCHHDAADAMEKIDRFMACEADKPQILYIWGHSYEFEVKNNWDRFEEICKKVSGRDDIFYGTNRQVLLHE